MVWVQRSSRDGAFRPAINWHQNVLPTSHLLLQHRNVLFIIWDTTATTHNFNFGRRIKQKQTIFVIKTIWTRQKKTVAFRASVSYFVDPPIGIFFYWLVDFERLVSFLSRYFIGETVLSTGEFWYLDIHLLILDHKNSVKKNKMMRRQHWNRSFFSCQFQFNLILFAFFLLKWFSSLISYFFFLVVSLNWNSNWNSLPM